MSRTGMTGPTGLIVFMTLLLPFETAIADTATTLTDRLAQTRAANLEIILDAQFKPGQRRILPGFRVPDPYDHAVAEKIQRWDDSRNRMSEVCAVQFLDPHRIVYELRTFPHTTAAAAADFTVTHQGRCGSCSALQDLSVYLSRPDLTTPARRCARKWSARRVRACFVGKIGLTPYCAESWTYNALHTRRACRNACVETYGLLNLMLHRYPAPNTTPDGQLNACLRCDEAQSGPGFRYSAGRTRRNSGIGSAIQRAPGELYPIDHRAYFKPVASDALPPKASPASGPEAG